MISTSTVRARAALLNGRSSDGVAWWGLIASALAPALLVSAWTLAGGLQPVGYRPLQQTISALAGPAATDRWIMTTGLFAVGACYVLAGAGLRGIWQPGRVLLVIAGVAAIGLALSPVPAHGMTSRHLAWTVVGATVMTVWPVFARHPEPPYRPILNSPLTALATSVFIALLLWTIVEAQLGQRLGLAERASTATQICWPVMVGVALRRNASRARHARAPGH